MIVYQMENLYLIKMSKIVILHLLNIKAIIFHFLMTINLIKHQINHHVIKKEFYKLQTKKWKKRIF